MRRAIMVFLVGAALTRAGYDAGAIPSLPPPADPVTVSTEQELVDAVAAASPGRTILLADGDYHLTSTLRIRTDSVALRGASDDPEKAVVHGRGFGHGDRGEELIKIEAEAVTLAFLTMRDVRGNGLKIQSGANHDLLVHNCHFIDICERSIKGPYVEPSRNGIVRYCVFEQVTPITESIPNLYAGGDYIAGMDMMRIEGWRIHDNLFVGIHGMNGGGRGAIFLWQECSDIVVERNTIVDCDRGIALGNYHDSESGDHVTNSICRNNFVASGRYDAGIEVAGVDNVKIYHNSVWKQDRDGSRGIRFIAYHTNVDFRNNLLHGRLIFDRGEAGVTSGNNLVGALDGYFAQPSAGDLHLTAGAVGALGQGETLEEVIDDWDGEMRVGTADLGADQREGTTGPVLGRRRAATPPGRTSARQRFTVRGRRVCAAANRSTVSAPVLLLDRRGSRGVRWDAEYRRPR